MNRAVSIASFAARYAALPRWARIAAKCVAVLVLTYLFVAVALFVLQRRLIFPAGRSEVRLTAAEFAGGRDLSDLTAKTADGLTLHGWLGRAPAEPERTADRRAVLYFHGNGADRRLRLSDVDALNADGWDVVLFDYRGYGENPGSPSEAGLRLDARAMWEATRELGYSPDRIVLAGTSLGGGVATRLAAELCDAGTPPAGLLLRSTFDSLTNAAANRFPWLPVRLLLRDRFESTAAAPRVVCPVFQAHGTADRIVPERLGEALFAAFPDRSAGGTPKTWLSLPGVGHNGVRRQAGARFADAESAFLKTVAGDDKPSGSADAVGVPGEKSRFLD
ncbi:MAG: alpha/beta hydrolase [Planctomycetota bacterium]